MVAEGPVKFDSAATRSGCTLRSASVPALTIALATALIAPIPATASAQPRFAATAFEDPVARQLYTAAYNRWHALDTTIAGYTAVIRQRVATAIRTPLKDRLVFSNEHAVRTFWNRGRRPVVKVLGDRTRHPGRNFALARGEAGWLDAMPYAEPFVPGSDHLFFGWDREQEIGPPGIERRSIIHPLAEGGDLVYRFRSGDTITLSLPDGRRVQAVGLEVVPLLADAFRITGTLWIDPESGALVRAVYKPSRQIDFLHDVEYFQERGPNLVMRLMPGVFKPVNMRLNSVFVDYGLRDFEHWLPRNARMELLVTVGVLKFPVSIDVAYEFESVAAASEVDRASAEEADSIAAARDSTYIASLLAGEEGVGYELLDSSDTFARRRASRFIVPKDRTLLEASPYLPSPIWEDAAGFASGEELEDYIRSLADVPVASQRAPWALRYGWGSPKMIRYNRVEGLGVGVEFDVGLLGPHTVATSGFFGLADLSPKVRVDLERSTVLRRLTLGAFHELRATDANAGHLAFGNSVTALFTGRDEGEYYKATGVDLTWRPPVGNRESFVFRAYAERHAAAETETDFAVFQAFDDSWRFRPNLEADETEEAGAELTLSSWWGEDVGRIQGGVDLYGQAAARRMVAGGGEPADGLPAERGDRMDYGRASAILRAFVPLAGSEWTAWRLGLEAGGGTTWGDAPAQRAWFLGSASTLRGYEASVVSGSSFMRGRVEVARVFEGMGASLFLDMGWAGTRADFNRDDILYGTGLGLSLMDGLIRADFAHGLRGPERRFRFHLYADAIL